jgi:repressor LexA
MVVFSLTPKQKKILKFIIDYFKKNGFAPSQKEIAQEFNFSSLGTVQNYLVRLEKIGAIKKTWNGKRAIEINLELLNEENAFAKQGEEKQKIFAESSKHEQVLIREQSKYKQNVSVVQSDLDQSEQRQDVSMERSEHKTKSSVNSDVSVIKIPVLGAVAAGFPIESYDLKEKIEVPSQMIKKNKNYFALKVQGDSMLEEGILDGDFVIIEKTSFVKNGDVVVALINNEATIKRYRKKSATILMKTTQNENESSDAKIENESEIENNTDVEVELIPANPKYKPIQVRKNQDFKIEGVMVGLIRIVK